MFPFGNSFFTQYSLSPAAIELAAVHVSTGTSIGVIQSKNGMFVRFAFENKRSDSVFVLQKTSNVCNKCRKNGKIVGDSSFRFNVKMLILGYSACQRYISNGLFVLNFINAVKTRTSIISCILVCNPLLLLLLVSYKSFIKFYVHLFVICANQMMIILLQ